MFNLQSGNSALGTLTVERPSPLSALDFTTPDPCQPLVMSEKHFFFPLALSLCLFTPRSARLFFLALSGEK